MDATVVAARSKRGARSEHRCYDYPSIAHPHTEAFATSPRPGGLPGRASKNCRSDASCLGQFVPLLISD